MFNKALKLTEKHQTTDTNIVQLRLARRQVIGFWKESGRKEINGITFNYV